MPRSLATSLPRLIRGSALLGALLYLPRHAHGQDEATPVAVEEEQEPNGVPVEEFKDPREFAPLSAPVVGDEATGFAKRTIGLLGFVTEPGPDGRQAGGALHVRGAALLFGPLVSARYLERHWIGYDTAGVTYSLSAQAAVGLRYQMGENQGPFARIEARGDMQRMGGWYNSSLRIPGVQVGYGLDEGPFMLDIFGHSSPSWTGRVRSREFTRPVEGAFVGGGLSLGVSNWLLHSDVSHLLGFVGGYWDVRSSLCSYWGKKPTRLIGSGRVATRIGPRSTDFSFGICTDVNSLTFPRSGEIQQKTDVGLSFVIGSFSRLDRTAVP